MAADVADAELKTIVSQTLESNGVLSKIRAQLRKSVFMALEEQDPSRTKLINTNKGLKDFVSNKEGLLVYALVRDFLQFFNLEYTLAVLDAESNTKETIQRKELCDEFAIKSSDEFPVLTEVLHAGRSNSRNNQRSPDVESSYSVVKDERSNISTRYSCLKGSENDEKESQCHVNASDISCADKVHRVSENFDRSVSSSADPFFDDPIPAEQSSGVMGNLETQGGDENSHEHKTHEEVGENKLITAAKISDPEKESSTNLTNLKNLPALPGIGNKEIPEDDDYDDDDFSSTSRSKSEKNISSEQSVEEDIEEVPDEILSHSEVDDLTSDKSISQIENVSGIDYTEKIES